MVHNSSPHPLHVQCDANMSLNTTTTYVPFILELVRITRSTRNIIQRTSFWFMFFFPPSLAYCFVQWQLIFNFWEFYYLRLARYVYERRPHCYVLRGSIMAAVRDRCIDSSENTCTGRRYKHAYGSFFQVPIKENMVDVSGLQRELYTLNVSAWLK